jgi:hypothetical protein
VNPPSAVSLYALNHTRNEFKQANIRTQQAPKSGFYRKHSIFTANARLYWEAARFWLQIDVAWPNPAMG